jgi:hypothetical protein
MIEIYDGTLGHFREATQKDLDRLQAYLKAYAALRQLLLTNQSSRVIDLESPIKFIHNDLLKELR